MGRMGAPEPSFARRGTRPGVPVGSTVWVKSFAGPAVAGLLCGLLAGAPRAEEKDRVERAREVERGDQLESQIQSELARQQELLDQMRSEDAARKDPAKRRERSAPADVIAP